MKVLKVAKSPHLSLVINFLYALFNCVIGFSSFSWWFVTLGAYYFVLAVARFSVLEVKRRSGGDAEMELFSKRITGILFIALSFCLIGIVILSAVKERGAEFHEIIMITIATYSFTKITMAIIGLSSARKSASPVTKTLRNISLADAFVSVYSMQRSMLVSFPGMRASNIRLFNVLTGTAVWILILLLGINLIGGKKVNMAKSKIVKANEKIAQTVVEGYKKIEKGVVEGYTKIEDKFVDAYLTKDGESVEEAKARLKNKDK